MTNEIVYGVLLVIAVLLVILFVSVWILPGHFVSKYRSRYKLLGDLDIAKLETDTKLDMAKLESDTRTAMVQLAVGLAGFTVLLTAVHSIGTANKNVNLATQGQLADRFSKAVEMVNQNDSTGDEPGSANGENGIGEVDPSFVARVGGVYALESIAEFGDDDFYLKPSIHVLATMIRRESPRSSNSSCTELDKNPDINPYAVPPTHKILGPDVDAALKTIQGLANSASDLAGELDLSHADLCIAFLSDAMFAGVQLRNSDLRGAIFDDANLTGAVLSAANLTGAHLPNAKLKGAIFWGTTLDGADLSCADLSEADLKNATLRDANLSGANLRSARNLEQKQLSKACYSKNAMHPLLPQALKDLKVNECGEESMWGKDYKPLYTETCPSAREDEAEADDFISYIMGVLMPNW